MTTIVRLISDLARTRTDGGHLAGVVRDAITTAASDVDAITEALRPYAHLYGAKLGDGRALLADSLQEAGVPRSTQQVVGLAPSAFVDAEVLLSLLNDPEFTQQLRAQLIHSAPTTP